MKIALDIDDTITKYPEFFSALSRKYNCIIVTSRSNTAETVAFTHDQMKTLDIQHSGVFFCDWSIELPDDISAVLEGPELLLYQKVMICQQESVDVIFDDDTTIQRLIKAYLPNISIFSPV